VPVYEQGWFDDRRPYLTMKLVEGHTLAALLRGRADPGQDLPRWLGVFEQVCQAMAYAHARGVVHRDLKPANIMVGAFGEVQVMDWGFAKQTDRETERAGERENGRTGERENDAASVSPSPLLPFSLSPGQPGVTNSGAMMGTP